MKIFKTEIFRYRKSDYNKIAIFLTIILNVAVAGILHYVNKGVKTEFLASLGFDLSALSTIKGNMFGIRYVFASFSAMDMLMLICGMIVAMIHCNDYSTSSVRWQQKVSKSRFNCYFQRVLAAGFYAEGIALVYGLCSIFTALLFFNGKVSLQDVIFAIYMSIMEAILIFAYIAFIYFFFELIGKQVLCVAFVFVLNLLLTPGLSVIFDMLGYSLKGNMFFIVSMLTNISTFDLSYKNILMYSFIGVLYFVSFLLFGTWAYGKKQL